MDKYEVKDGDNLLFSAAEERLCWNYVRNMLLHPSKTVRRQAKSYEVFNEGVRCFRVPHSVKSLYEL